MDIVTADIKINGSTIFVTFLKADGWPFELENDTDYTVFVCQWVRFPLNAVAQVNDRVQDAGRNEVEAVKSSIPRYKLAPHSVTQYAWDHPAAREKKLMLVINDARRVVDIMEIGVLVPFKFQVRVSGILF